MMWKDDPSEYEKYLTLDAIVKFVGEKGTDFSKVTFKELTDFIDDFFEERNENAWRVSRDQRTSP